MEGGREGGQWQVQNGLSLFFHHKIELGLTPLMREQAGWKGEMGKGNVLLCPPLGACPTLQKGLMCDTHTLQPSYCAYLCEPSITIVPRIGLQIQPPLKPSMYHQPEMSLLHLRYVQFVLAFVSFSHSPNVPGACNIMLLIKLLFNSISLADNEQTTCVYHSQEYAIETCVNQTLLL